jgi:hypothetical protein
MAKSESPAIQGPKYALIKTAFDLEASKKNYQVLLQNLAAASYTKDNVNEDITKDGREILKMLEEKKELEAADFLQGHRDVMAIYKDLTGPIKEQVDRLLAEKKKVAQEIAAETAKQLAEQNRINAAKKAIIDFGNKVANLISAAKTDDDIVAIEKMMGSEKTKTTVYQEFIPDLIAHCDTLRPAVKTQKENIRALQKIEDDEKLAILSGDVQAQTDLRDKKEHFVQVIHETGIRIHEAAFDQATNIEIVVPEVADTAPKGRTNWKWRVDDITLLQKKMPQLVKVVPNDEAINLLLATKRQDGSLKDKLEEKYFGITFFNDKSFTK